MLKANSPLIKLADAFRKGEVEKSKALQVIEQALAHRLLKIAGSCRRFGRPLGNTAKS